MRGTHLMKYFCEVEPPQEDINLRFSIFAFVLKLHSPALFMLLLLFCASQKFIFICACVLEFPFIYLGESLDMFSLLFKNFFEMFKNYGIIIISFLSLSPVKKKKFFLTFISLISFLLNIICVLNAMQALHNFGEGSSWYCKIKLISLCILFISLVSFYLIFSRLLWKA